MLESVRVFGLDPAIDAQVRVESLVLEHQTKLTAFLRRFVGDRDTACDLAQEVFVSAYAMLRAEPARPLSAGWLFKSATNRAISYLRKRRHVTSELNDNVAGALRFDEATALSLDVQAALARLPHSQVACVLLTAYAGYSSHEAGLLLGISADAVRQRVCRGLHAMRALLTEPAR